MQLPDLSLLLVMAVFWATYAVLRRFVFTPLGRILGEREVATSQSAAALEAAVARERETLVAVDQKLTAARRAAMAAREAARQSASSRRQGIVDAAREDARASAEEYQRKLEAEVAAARGELRRGASVIAGEIAEMALGRKVA
jgi:F0F1-type ATP synthase membrane subunit b/b'